MLRGFLKTDNIYDIIHPFYVLTKLNGLSPFSIIGDRRNGKIQTTFMDFIWFIWALVVRIGILFINFNENYSLNKNITVLIDGGSWLALIIATFNICLMCLINGLARHKIWNMFRRLYQFDCEVR